MQDMKYRQSLRFIFITYSRLIRCVSPGMSASLLQIESILRNQGLSSKNREGGRPSLFWGNSFTKLCLITSYYYIYIVK